MRKISTLRIEDREAAWGTRGAMLDDWVAKRAETSPDRVALVGAGREVTYGELEELAVAAARRLAGRGVRRGQVVALALPAGIEYAVALHAIAKLGAITMPLNPGLSDVESQILIDTARPVLIVREPADAAGPEADLPLLGEHGMGEVHCRLHTSGSAGLPKPVDLTYGNHLWSAVGSAFNLGVDPTERWLCCLPLHHVGGFSILLRSAIYGTTAILHDGFDAERVAAALRNDGVTIVSLVATGLVRLLEAGAELDRPRVILVGGGPVPVAVLEQAAGAGATVVQSYGLTEAASQVTTLAAADAARKRGSAGRSLLTTHVRIEEGEILVQGPTVAPACLEEDGWLHTGDLGHIDEDGFLYVHDRADDLIVSGGENVSPVEVERVLLDHSAVADAAVVGRADPEWQEAVTAVVVLRTGSAASAEELGEHCRRSLAAFKVPKHFEFTAELPRTPAGKLLRRALR